MDELQSIKYNSAFELNLKPKDILIKNQLILIRTDNLAEE